MNIDLRPYGMFNLLAASINMGHESQLKNVLLILVNFTCKL